MVNIDTVYQRVLALANKEQRGYITPQEYNLLANQAQMQIFESYFYTKNQRDRLEPDRNHEIDETDISELVARKLRPFSEIVSVLGGSMFPDNVTIGTENLEVFQVGNIYFNSNYPDGQPRRCLDTSRASNMLGFEAKTELHDGLKETLNWFCNNKEKFIDYFDHIQ